MITNTSNQRLGTKLSMYTPFKLISHFTTTPLTLETSFVF